MEAEYGDEPCPIAIVGVACRFPGDASNPEGLWDVLSNGRSAFKEFPQDRLNINGFYHPSPDRSDSFNFKGAHFIREDIAAFDAKFFGVASAEADAIDPQQRLLLEVSYEAIENAGFPMETFKGTRTSVFVGSFVKDYEQISMRDSQTTAPDCATGNGIAIMANRISYFFDLQGTSQTIDTGCSASLVCVHQGVHNLRNGQSDIAIAGGAGLILTPSTIMPMTSLGFLSADGKCFTFDSRANGYGRGEGVGIVVLKRLDDAVRDNDTIRAVIRGTASNQDGHTAGITVPNPEAQVRCIKAAYKNAGLGIDKTAYVECHGTGTKAGDWRELKAISDALSLNRAEDNPMFVGSVKPNIGHLEGSAGVAGLIKAILISEKGQIPPHINFKKWNPDIKHKDWRVDIAKDLMKFPSNGLRRISVNCFGFGGTNAHGVLDDARTFLAQRGLTAYHNTTDPQDTQIPDDESTTASEAVTGSATPPGSSMSSWDLASDLESNEFDMPYLFAFSSQHRDGLPQLTSSYAPYLMAGASSPGLLRDCSYTLYSRRSHLDYRSYFVAKSVSELTQKMAKLNASEAVRAGMPKPFRPALIFCGQGAQWPRMAMELMNFHAFRESIETADNYMRLLDGRFNLEEKLNQSKDKSDINLPEIAQPATTAIQVALVDLLKACKIKPVSVAGHSSGEIAAAYAAGILTREDAWELAFYRGQCAASLKKIDSSLRGRMVAAALSRSEAQKYIELLVRPGSATVACINSPQLVTLSGDEDSILTLKTELGKRDVFTALVAVDIAYHSHHMKIVSQRYLDFIKNITPRAGSEDIAMYSSVSGKRVVGPELDAAYWVKNMVSPVEFERAVAAMMEPAAADRIPTIFIEVSPHRVWAKALKQTLDTVGFKNSPVPYLSMLERGNDAVAMVLQLVGDLFLHGDRVNMEWFYRSKKTRRLPKCLVDLPTYPWDHSKTYWHESHLSRAHRFRQFGRRDYIGAPTADSVLPYEPKWRGFFRVFENPWLQDHKVRREMLYPAAGMVVMAIEAARQVVYDVIDQPSDILDFEVSQFEIKAPMVIPAEDSGLEHSINAKKAGESSLDGVTTWVYEFAIYSKPYQDAPFQENAKGTFAVRFYRRGAERRGNGSLLCKSVDAKSRDEYQSGKRGQSTFEFYEGLDVVGMNYGRLFRNIADLGQANSSGAVKECWASITIPDTKEKMPMQFEFDHIIHPATLDAVFQTLFTLGSDPMVPFFIDRIRVAANVPCVAGARLFGTARGANVGLREASADIDIWATGPDGEIGHRHVVEINGLRAVSIASTAAGRVGFLPSHRNLSSSVVWKEDVEYASIGEPRKWLSLLGHKYPGISILHIGENSQIHKTAFQALAHEADGWPSDTPRLSSYTISAETDKVYEATLAATAEQHRPLLAYEPPSALSLAEEAPRKFDLIIVEDTTTLLSEEEIKRLVKPSGFIMTTAKPGKDLQNLAKRPATRHQSPPQSTEQEPGSGSSAVQAKWVGMKAVANIASDAPTSGSGSRKRRRSEDDDSFAVTQLLREIQDAGDEVQKATKSQDIVILVPDVLPTTSGRPAERLQEDLSRVGFEASIQPISWLEGTSRKHNNTLFISLLELYETDGFVLGMDERQYELVKRLLQTPKGLLWVSRGGQTASGAERPWNALFLGWSRTVRSEDSTKDIVCLDVQSGDAVPTIRTIFIDSFINPAKGIGGRVVRDTEYAEVGGRILIPRLMPIEGLNNIIEHGREKGLRFERGSVRSVGDRIWLGVGSPGNLSSLYFGQDQGPEVKAEGDRVRITVRQAYLLPGDLDTVLGKNSRTSIGVEVVGIVHSVGGDVKHTQLQPGQEVVAIVSGGAVRGTVSVPESSVTVRPAVESPCLPWSMAAALAAHRSALGVARAGTAMAVLVYGAAGAFGQAAIAVFGYLNANVIAVVSSDQQEEALKTVFDIEDRFIVRESPDLVDRVRQLARELGSADEHGVDLVFDPTANSAHMDTNFACVATHGRVFQVVTSSADWSDIRLPRRSFEFVRFNLDEHIERGVSLGRDFKDMYEAITIKAPRPAQAPNNHVYSFGHVDEAFKQMERDPALGTYIVEFDKEEHVRIGYSPASSGLALESQGIYIVVGGFGGLGLGIAEWLVEKGAGHIVLVSRSAAPQGDRSTGRFNRLRQSPNVQVHAYQLDICNAADVAVFANWLVDTGLKVRGVVHAAGMLRDYTYLNMQHEDWVFASKVKTVGSWNLHQALPRDMDFFLFLSSAAGVIGNRGQSNYAAGNAFQDALAHHRTARGMYTVSLDLGPIIGAGMVGQEMMDLLRSVGYFGIRLSDVFFVMERAVVGVSTGTLPVPAQVVMGVGTGGLMRQTSPADPFWSDTALFAQLNRVDLNGADVDVGGGGSGGGSDGNLQPRLKMANTVEECVEIILGPLIAAMVSIIPNIEASDIQAYMTPNECRSDSMRGTNIDNWLKRTTGVSIGQAINGMPLQKICEEVVKRGEFVTA
ncbi:hypothetical protein B0H67DRAFT_677874 [Lasiosphaeris hirsuta]|uniref:Carrier domain-containing protein n=1 Tax=Lasiosphaeris hirsuta TaxID=260670 RepID=A0AA40E9D6_9PEZI|nr:hypothetical protein B0H67DRAFT_677874 [Lasiosphaeris hirsuta]